MCRLVAYLGEETLLADVIYKPSNSLIKQSLHAKESKVLTNGDGFGIGWYMPEISPDPALFTSILPAWNDLNLLHITSKTKSNTFFAHVRSASVGGVSQANCHPFVFNQWMLMHNGRIENFQIIKRHLRKMLDDDIYNWVKGQTDTEHIFALFLQLAKQHDLTELSKLAHILQETMQIIIDLLVIHGQKPECFFNICLTDGKRLLASRYCTNANCKPDTLHYSISFISPHIVTPHVLVASERLTDVEKNWNLIPPSHFLLVDTDFNVDFQPINVKIS